MNEKRPRKTYADTIKARAASLKDVYERRKAGEDVRLYIPTGLKVWDENGGIERGVLTVIGAGTGDGKSVMKLHLAQAAAKAGHTVLMVDFEDPGEKTADRTFSTETGVNSRKLAQLDVDDFQIDQVMSAAAASEGWASRIEHHEDFYDSEELLRLMRSGTWDLILVDYVQCLPDDEGRTTQDTLKRFSQEANDIAKQERCGVVLFSQLNRTVEEDGKKTLMQARFRDPDSNSAAGFRPVGKYITADCVALASSAKCLLFLWRPNRIRRNLGDGSVKDNRMHVVIAKANFAREGDMEFLFDAPTATLKDIS